MKFTPTEWRVIVAAHMTGNALMADIDSKRVRSRTISKLTAAGLLYSPTIAGEIELTPLGCKAYWEKSY